MSNSHLETRGGVHWYRRRIPHDLISAYGGQREIRYNLRTSNKKAAIQLARLKSVELDGEFERKRKERGPLQTPTELTDAQIRRVCALWQRSVLETDDQSRMGGFFETDYDDLSVQLADVEPALRQALVRGQLDTLIGNDVYHHKGEDLGDIKEIMLDLRTGKVGYSILSFGGFLGMGEKLFAVPWNALTLDTENKRFVLKMHRDSIRTGDPTWRTNPGRKRSILTTGLNRTRTSHACNSEIMGDRTRFSTPR